MTISCDHTSTSGVRRFEAFTGASRRRDWPADVKLANLAVRYFGGLSPDLPPPISRAGGPIDAHPWALWQPVWGLTPKPVAD